MACLFYLHQYFLSRELSFLLNCGKITSIQGYVNIETARLFCPVGIIVVSKYKVLLNGSLLFKDRLWGTAITTQQKFHENKQAGGGAYIPASLKITGPQQHDIRTRATSTSVKMGMKCQLIC